jgi:hypothetical protein
MATWCPDAQTVALKLLAMLRPNYSMLVVMRTFTCTLIKRPQEATAHKTGITSDGNKITFDITTSSGYIHKQPRVPRIKIRVGFTNAIVILKRN